jgi:dolichol-phosphate mannosyltransferase
MKAMVMLPTYNERENIEAIVSALLDLENNPAFQETGFEELEVLVVDDDSPDGTGLIGDEIAEKYKGRVHVMHRQQRGRGTAGLDGLRYAREQDIVCVIEMDADFSHDPGLIPRFLEAVKEHDVVIGSRFVERGRTEQSLFRRFLSKCASIYLQVLLGTRIKDWQSGYRCFRREALLPLDLQGMALQSFSREYAIGISVLYQLVKMGCSYERIPIEFNNRQRGQSKLSLRQIWSYIGIALALRLGRRKVVMPGPKKMSREAT